MNKIAANLKVFAQAIEAHDHLNPDHISFGIGLSAFDMDRLGIDEGEQILPGKTIQCDGKTSGNFRILCDGEHDPAPKVEVDERVPVAADRG